MEPAAAVTHRFSVAGGVELHVLARNAGASGVPVLAVHGLSSNARLWDGVAEHLAAAGHPVAAVDLRGHGLSGKPDGGYDFATLTADLVRVLDHLGWGQAWAAGQSWGANVVLELAARHPDMVSGVALVDGGTIELADRFADWPACEAAMAPPVFDGTTAAAFEAMLRARHPDWPESGIAGTLANVEVRADGTVAPWLSRSNHLAILHHLWEHHPSQRYPLVSAPVLILPAEDPTTSATRWMSAKRLEVARAGETLATSVTRWMAGDHDLHAQHPAEVAQLVHDATGPDLFPQ